MKHLFYLSACAMSLVSGNLTQLIDAAHTNHAINAATHTIASAQAQKEALWRGYMPHITLGGSHAFNEIESAMSPQKSTTGFAKVAITLYDGGKREALLKASDASIAQAKLQRDATQEEMALHVTYAYFSTLSLKEQLKATQQKITQLEAERLRLEKFLQAGTTTHDVLQRIIASLEATKVEKLGLEDAITQHLSTLRYLTQQEVEVEEGSVLHVDERLEAHERSDLKALEQAAFALKAQAEASKAAHLPTLVLEDTLTRYDNRYANPAFDAGLDHQNTLALSLQWKVFDFGSTSAHYEAGYQSYLSTQSTLAFERAKAKASITNAKNSYQRALAQIQSQAKRLDAAQLSYALVEKKFHNGIVDNVVYLDALSEMTTAYAQYHTARFDAQYQSALLLHALGHNLLGAIQ